MSGWDADVVSSVNLGLQLQDQDAVLDLEVERATRMEMQSKFRQFLRTFVDDSNEYIYRDELRANYEQNNYYIKVDLMDINAFDPLLFKELLSNPEDSMHLFETSALEVLRSLATGIPPSIDEMHPLQIQLVNYPTFEGIRSLSSKHVSTLVTVRGIVVSSGRATIKATRLNIMCRNCRATKKIKVGDGFGSVKLPRRCDTMQNQNMVDSGMQKCPLDPFEILSDTTEYTDHQRLKLQENPEMVPTGEMPRHISISLDRYLVDTVKPGTRIKCTGVFTTYQKKGRSGRNDSSDSGVRIPYMRAFGIQQDNSASDLLSGKFTPEDQEEINRIQRLPQLYEKISSSIAPALFGHNDIKKAIALQLFGGTRKHLPDGMRLRGDINVLLLGDPSCGKSQFLKFAVQAAPIGVYTSGKGSSAAGLTASVLRDPASGQFHLEGGALVLADGGMVCIDEFDKMREQDRVAIHEAMEQQTISIAKAGITTILNSRTSVLAAANPIFGRYDDMKTATENIDFQTTILSRFDLIFIVRDTQDNRKDINLAKHILNIHKHGDAAVKTQESAGMVDIEILKKYIAYARQKSTPRLSDEAAAVLKARYVSFRSTMRDKKRETGNNAIPITVRQLEAIVRLAEALARMELSEVATELHVKEALRLFQVSTFQAATSSFGESVGRADFAADVKQAERFVLERVAIGTTTGTERLRREMMKKGHPENAVVKAIDLLVVAGKLRYKNQRKMVERTRA